MSGSDSRTLKAWLGASIVALLAAATWLVAALADQSAINDRIADTTNRDRAAPVPGLADGVIRQLDDDPATRPAFFDELSDLWFVSRLQDVSDEQFLAGIGNDAAARYLAAYDHQLQLQRDGRYRDGDRDRPLVNANDHFLRGLLRSAVQGRAATRQTLDDLDMALTLDPDHDSALATRGRLANEAGQHAIAAVDLQRALDINPHRWSVWLQLARAHRAAGNADAAAQAFTGAVDRAPDSRRAAIRDEAAGK